VPSFGDASGRLLIVGLAPGLQGANRTGRPFTGDYAGDLLYSTLRKFGFSTGTFRARPDDGLANGHFLRPFDAVDARLALLALLLFLGHVERVRAGEPVAAIEELDDDVVRGPQLFFQPGDAGGAALLLLGIEVLAGQVGGVARVGEADGPVVGGLAHVAGQVVGEGALGLPAEQVVQLQPAVLFDGVVFR